jgi:hypothetical protein
MAAEVHSLEELGENINLYFLVLKLMFWLANI